MGYDPIGMGDSGAPFEPKCSLCRKPCLHWQRFCGAACCAQWEGGKRPAEVSALPELDWRGRPVK